MIYLVTIGEKKFTVSIDGDPSSVKIDGREINIDHFTLRGKMLHSILVDNINYEFVLERSEGGFNAWSNSEQLHVEICDEKTEKLKKLAGGMTGRDRAEVLKAPMPGLIVRIEIEIGQQVKKGDGLLIVEAMKMENEIKANAPGVVKEIRVKSGQAVEKNQVLVIFE